MYISRKQKRNISVWIILAVFLLAGVFLFSNLDKKSDPEMAKQLSGDKFVDGNQAIEDNLSENLKNYLSRCTEENKNGDYLLFIKWISYN